MNFKIKSTDLTKEQVDRIYKKTLDCWVMHLHGLGYLFANKSKRKLTYYEEAEVFLAIFKRFVDDGLILVDPPHKSTLVKKIQNEYFWDRKPDKNEPIKKVQGHEFWNVSSDEMIKYIRKILPKDPIDLSGRGDGEKFCKFWYEDCPRVTWIDKRDRKIFIIGKIIKQNFKRKARKGRKIKFSPVEVKSK